ncbi:MAG: hypothetical protein K5989_03700 [Lachnospiraceae bacterium]|nr:hypothetical protein [Lachnospiraceae bacterium]
MPDRGCVPYKGQDLRTCFPLVYAGPLLSDKANTDPLPSLIAVSWFIMVKLNDTSGLFSREGRGFKI